MISSSFFFTFLFVGCVFICTASNGDLNHGEGNRRHCSCTGQRIHISSVLTWKNVPAELLPQLITWKCLSFSSCFTVSNSLILTSLGIHLNLFARKNLQRISTCKQHSVINVQPHIVSWSSTHKKTSHTLQDTTPPPHSKIEHTPPPISIPT